MRRRLLFSLLALVGLVLLIAAALPLWLGPALRWFGPSRGLTYAAYERLPDGRFALRDVQFARGNVRVTASRVEADTPLLWLWRHSRTQPTAVVVDKWSVEVKRADPAAPKTPSKTEPGWAPLHAQLRNIAAQLDRWLPNARAGAGVVRWPTGEISANAARWRDRTLVVDALSFRALTANATVAFPAEADVLRLSAGTPDKETALALESRGRDISGELTWAQQKATLSAKFDPRGWVPREATVQADQWRLPGERVKLGAVYAAVRGSGRIEWRGDAFNVDVTAASDPLQDKKAPPLSVALRGHGDTRAFTIATLDAALPGVTAKLSAPVTVDRAGKFTGPPADFTLHADLAQQPWFAARGVVDGSARVLSVDGAAIPRVDFQLRASDVNAANLALAEIAANGALTWPRLEIATAHLTGGAGERLELRGGWDFRAKEILPSVVDGQIRRASIARWLPAQPQFDAVALHAEASGPLASVAHEGKANADGVKFNGINAAKLTLAWRGHGIGAEQFEADAQAGATSLVLAGAANRDAIMLRQLRLSRANNVLLALTQPATLRWKPALQLDELHLAGPGASLDGKLAWGASGHVELAARNIVSEWFADLLPTRGPAWRLELLAATGNWDRGPMTFSLTAGAAVELGDKRTAAVNLATRGDGEGLRIEALRATESDATVVNAVGRVPVVLHPGTARLVELQENGALQLEASAAPNAMFWSQLAEASGVELKTPQASLHLGGTWARPEGNVRLSVERLAFDPKRFARELPAVEGIDVQLTGDRDALQLDRFALKVEGQPIRAQGRLPIVDGRWDTLLKQPLAALEKGGDLRLEIPEADIAVFARFLPAFLAPKGRVQLDAAYAKGALTGSLKLRDAASRPLGPLGVLQEINADLALDGRRLELRGVNAKSGGQPLVLNGVIELPEFAALHKGGAAPMPRYDIALRGENLPFVRQTGLIVRGDLDLKLQTQADAKTAKISGTVNLRDSLFLQDVRAFLPKGGGGSASRRPPYFEVTTPPLNTWPLAVEVTGDSFMRLSTPVFSGVASAHFRLGGTLGEPRAIGEVVIEEGRVKMPFASFDVRQGSVRLSESNPYEPTIYLRGTSRRYGYDLTMEIEGKASAPNVEFTSSPALDSEQVLLMVMTGAAPQNEVNRSLTQRAAGVGMFVGQNLLSSLRGDTGDADKLTIASGEKVTREGGKETYEIEYKLSDRWAVTGEYNEFGEYNAGLKWRLHPRQTEEEKRREAAKNASKLRQNPPPAEGEQHARN